MRKKGEREESCEYIGGNEDYRRCTAFGRRTAAGTHISRQITSVNSGRMRQKWTTGMTWAGRRPRPLRASFSQGCGPCAPATAVTEETDTSATRTHCQMPSGRWNSSTSSAGSCVRACIFIHSIVWVVGLILPSCIDKIRNVVTVKSYTMVVQQSFSQSRNQSGQKQVYEDRSYVQNDVKRKIKFSITPHAKSEEFPNSI